jgi:hypothetical protein
MRIGSAWSWLFAVPATLRFPTDCTEAGPAEVALEQLDVEIIRAARLVPGHRGAWDIEVTPVRGRDVSRVRAEIVRVLPPGIGLVGGPSPMTGIWMGS